MCCEQRTIPRLTADLEAAWLEINRLQDIISLQADRIYEQQAMKNGDAKPVDTR